MKPLLNLILRNKNIIFLLIASFFYFIANAFLQKFIAENFGANGLLEFNYAFNLLTILLAVACFGSETALVRQSIFFETKNISGFNDLYSTVSFFGLVFIFCIYLLRGIITPILRNEININTTSNKRATVLSIRSFIIRISFAISAPILGYIAENYSLANSFYVTRSFVNKTSLNKL